ncbi:MAG: dihydroorotate dehydrogenase [Burkholderiaceae bacterium]|nr:dihydroorotate dehydrogenase [Burkholderiaceae bacterium]
MNGAWWRGRRALPGLAGGIDKDGGRAAELLAAGFGSVEFGTVTPRPEAGGNPGVAELTARLRMAAPCSSDACRIGIGIGMNSAAPPDALAAEWLSGLELAWGAADYLSFNLSARAYRPLLAPTHLPMLLRAFQVVTAERDRLCGDGAHFPLTLKVPLGVDDPFPLTLAVAAADAGFDMLTAVLPDSPARLDRLNLLAARLPRQTTLLAVGGIRNHANVRAALAAGAHGVQVHRIFAELGAACLPDFLATEATIPADIIGDAR